MDASESMLTSIIVDWVPIAEGSALRLGHSTAQKNNSVAIETDIS